MEKSKIMAFICPIGDSRTSIRARSDDIQI
jgi:hypothetical protein